MPSFLPVSTSVHLSIFYNSSQDNGKDLLVYTRRQKDTTTTPPLVATSDSGNVPLDSRDEEDFPIALRKGKRSCNNHQISNFVPY